MAAGLALCALLGAASLLVRPTTLGYDPFAWMVWARQLLWFELDTTSGPSWKPLPALLAAPLTPFGDAAPIFWMWLMRTASLAAFLFAYRAAVRLGGSAWAGAAAVVGLGVSVDLFSASLRGYSEPLLLALVLAAVEAGIVHRWRLVLGLLALGGLLRPELWVFSLGVGLFVLVRAGRFRDLRDAAVVAGLVAVAPLIWLGLDLVGSGDALQASTVARTSPPGSAASTPSPTLTVLGRAVDAVLIPTLMLAVIAVAVSIRRRRVEVLVLAGLALVWVAEIAIFAELGYTGRRRYVLAAAAVVCVVSGVGMGELVRRAKRWRPVVVLVVGLLFAATGFSSLQQNVRRTSHGADLRAQQQELVAAVKVAEGRGGVERDGGAVVNSYLQTMLAWQLGVALADVDKPSGFKRRRVGYEPPAVVFRAPERLAGPRPVIPKGASSRSLGRAGRWRVIRVTSFAGEDGERTTTRSRP